MIRLFSTSALGLAACLSFTAPALAQEIAPRAVISAYADLGKAMYGDALTAAKGLQTAIEAFLAKPNAETLAAARKAWINARPWYQQTEVFRFGNKAVDEMEGKVNAWPLDEGLIDYVNVKKYGEKSEENPLFRANIIASKKIKVGKTVVDARKITKELIGEKLHEAGGVEKNVASGYHAIEFLLWGQDLNGTGPGAGDRKASDFDLKTCTNGHCERRRTYLKSATDLLIDDLTTMAGLWEAEGEARKALLAKDDAAALSAIVTGLGSLSYGELAGERMKLGLILHDPEEEHDCFSDNTHNSHYYDQVGMISVWRGAYKRLNGSTLAGPSLLALAKAKAPEEAAKADAAFDAASAKLMAIKQTADSGKMAYDQMIGAGNAEGNALVQAGVDALIAQTRGLEGVVGKLGLTIGLGKSDSLDAPDKVKK